MQIPKNLKYKIVGNTSLTDHSVDEILKDIALRIDHGRRLIIPIGMGGAGKSMFLGSLIAYAFKRKTTGKDGDNSCNFDHVFLPKDSGIEQITDALDDKRVLPSTRGNEITIIDLNMKSRYRKRTIQITLIDTAGEDIERLIGKRDDTEGSAKKIEQILNACVAQRAIFAILTPVEMGTHLKQVTGFDTREDSDMSWFIDKLRENNLRLYSLTKFLFIVSKWDWLPHPINPAKYLQYHRQQLFDEYSSSGKYGLIPYSVGNVVGETIMNIDLRSPKNFWYTLYRWCTGKHVLPWWKRWFS